MASKEKHAKRSKRSSHLNSGFASFRADSARKSYLATMNKNQRRVNNGRRKTGTD